MDIKNYDPLKLEPEILAFWEKSEIYKKAKEKCKKGKPFYFLDGPPYTSGKVHIGTAWNKSLKDTVLRFKRMNNLNVWDRAGYDMHGLPTAHKVEEKFKIKHKEEISKFGVAKFISECEKLSLSNLKIMNKDFQRLGVWMDFENAYKSIDSSFIEGEWWLVKKAHENKRLYEGEKVMHWCPECATALAKHELEYKNVKDDSIFLKFKLKDEDAYLIVWTTTPWTIPFNLGVMVNPEETYVKAKVDNETWIVAAKLAGVFIQGVADKQYKVLEEFKGSELEGKSYIEPSYEDLKDIYDDLKKQSPKVHTIVLSKEYVDTTSGTGLVHMAPGCGPEDYEIGYKNKILPFNNLDEEGKFPKNMGPFKDWIAKKDDSRFIEYFKENKALIESTEVEHEYAHCWRCHNPVIFRLTKQWFFKIEDLKEKLRELNKKITWQPDWAGNKQFDSWLDNLRDNSITRQRYWGCPVPIWKCDKCDKYEVIGSIKELEQKSNQKAPENLHIPHIDKITIPCSCSATMKRIPDILDVWVDAGTTSWTCLDYPQKEDLFKKLWPADFILEGKDQIRGWFNLLFVASMVSMNKPSYKAVYMHGFVNDAKGRKMSKSLGNYILPEEVIEKYGSDTFRYYMIGAANPGVDLNYNFEDMKLKNRNLAVLWNIHKFLIDFSKELNKNPAKIDDIIMQDLFSLEESYIISKLNSTIESTTEMFNKYQLNEVPLVIEELFLSLSRTYIQLVRDKAALGDKTEKELVLYTVYKTLMESLKLFAPIIPFTTEAIYQNLKQAFNLKQESIHLFDWPKADKKLINKDLEEQVKVAGDIIQSILSAREKAQLGLRWPLKQAIIVTDKENITKAVNKLKDIIKTQTNTKKIDIDKSFSKVKETVKADYAKLGPIFGNKSPKIIAHIATHSTETLMKHIEKDGKYKFKLDNENIEITKDHLIITREVPSSFTEAEFKGGLVYINKERTEELEAEGYAREVMRRIQSLRKDSGLNKTDSISLFIQAEEDLVKMLSKHEDIIKEKVGAKKLKISEEPPAKKHKFTSKEKVKDYKFELFFDKN